MAGNRFIRAFTEEHEVKVSAWKLGLVLSVMAGVGYVGGLIDAGAIP